MPNTALLNKGKVHDIFLEIFYDKRKNNSFFYHFYISHKNSINFF